MRTVVRETKGLDEDLRGLAAAYSKNRRDLSLASEMLTKHTSVRQNKRCLHAYLGERADRIRRLCWELGAVPPPEVKANMSRAEQEFYRGYSKVLTSYKAHYLDLDLTAASVPPKELFVEVRVLRDCGELQTEYGVVNLQKNSQHFLRRTDVEHLIKQGYLQHLG